MLLFVRDACYGEHRGCLCQCTDYWSKLYQDSNVVLSWPMHTISASFMQRPHPRQEQIDKLYLQSGFSLDESRFEIVFPLTLLSGNANAWKAMTLTECYAAGWTIGWQTNVKRILRCFVEMLAACSTIKLVVDVFSDVLLTSKNKSRARYPSLLLTILGHYFIDLQLASKFWWRHKIWKLLEKSDSSMGGSYSSAMHPISQV